MHLICPTAPAEYFSHEGWTENIDLPVGQIKAGQFAIAGINSDQFFTPPWRGRVGSHGAQRNVRRGGVIPQHEHGAKRRTATPPLTRRPRERASLVSTPPGEGVRTRMRFSGTLPGR